MKSKLIDSKTAGPTYPYLGKSKTSSLVVLFTADGVGTAVVGDKCSNLGYMGRSWHMPNFDRLPPGAQIVLEQE